MTTEEKGPPSLGDLFIKTHTSKITNEPLDDASRRYINQMREEAGTDENGDQHPITDAIYRNVMPEERHGRVRMMGPFGTKTVVFGLESACHASSSTRIQGLEAKLSDMTSEVDSLKRKLQENESEMENRIKEREAEMEMRMIQKLKEMLVGLGQSDLMAGDTG